MPRKARRTLSGAPAQAARMPVDSTYGEGERALESQRRTPIPDYSRRLQAVPNGPAAAGPSAGPGTSAPLAPADRLAQVIQAAQRMAPPESITAPTRRPNEPLTAGMALGPGPGSEVLRTGDRVVRTFEMLATITADPSFHHLAELAAQRMQ